MIKAVARRRDGPGVRREERGGEGLAKGYQHLAIAKQRYWTRAGRSIKQALVQRHRATLSPGSAGVQSKKSTKRTLLSRAAIWLAKTSHPKDKVTAVIESAIDTSPSSRVKEPRMTRVIESCTSNFTNPRGGSNELGQRNGVSQHAAGGLRCRHAGDVAEVRKHFAPRNCTITRYCCCSEATAPAT